MQYSISADYQLIGLNRVAAGQLIGILSCLLSQQQDSDATVLPRPISKCTVLPKL